MSIGLKSDSSGTSGSILINGSDAVLVTPTGITTASIQDSSITTAKIADGNITYGKLSTSATEADNVAKRTAKAWVNFNGTGTVAIRGTPFNVSSITDHGVGDYSVNFSTAFADSNYAATIGFEQVDAVSSTLAAGIKTMSTSAVRIKSERSNGADEDLNFVCLSAFSS
jgi:hypothetical protein